VGMPETGVAGNRPGFAVAGLDPWSFSLMMDGGRSVHGAANK
jgi:hypothetical protein